MSFNAIRENQILAKISEFTVSLSCNSCGLITCPSVLASLTACCGRPWPAAYINFNQNIRQIQVLTKPLCRAQALFYSLPNNEWGTKYRGLAYSAK